MKNSFNIEKLISKVKLDVNDFDINAVQADFDNIISWIKDIEKIDVEGIEPCFNILAQMGFQNCNDDIAQTEDVGEIMSNAPSSENDYFIVPKVIKS